MPGPATRLTLLPYLQSYDGTQLAVRLVLLPGGSPLAPLTTGADPFSTVSLSLSQVLTSGLADMPPAGTQTVSTALAPAPAQANALFTQLASTFAIDPAPPPASPRRAATILKHLPPSYREAAGVDTPSSPFAKVDDCYACAHRQVPTPKSLPTVDMVPWGRVIAISLRQPVIAEALGLCRALTVAVPSGALDHGGWLHVTLDPGGDAGLLSVPGAIAVYAARIPPLSAARSLFTAVLFPVPPSGTAEYDAPFAEAIDYADGFAKIVHVAQQRFSDPLVESDDGTRPARETGVRIAWDDEQVATWLNRQVKVLGAADPDTTMGVAGYRVDARELGDAAWHSLCEANGPVNVGPMAVGTFTGELQVETHPVQLDAEVTGEFWLSAYFARWTGGPVIGGDPIGMQVIGAPPPPAGRVTPTAPAVALRYGASYEFRVRLADHSGGGPAVGRVPRVPAIAPTATLAFRRWVRPGRPSVTPSTAPDAVALDVGRPRLGYPAYVFTGAANAVNDLLADRAAAAADGREPGLPDPDVASVRVAVQARALGADPLATDGYVTHYTATRDFPAGLGDVLTLELEWQDVPDATRLSDPGAGALQLPTSRDLRLELRALGRGDPGLDYFGADDVRLGAPAEVRLRKDAADERGLLLVGSPADFLRALYLQPDPVDDPTLTNATRAAGQSGQPGDSVARVATLLDLDATGLTIRARPGVRLAFGAAAGLEHALGPDHGSLTVASRSELTRRWLVVLRARLARDWTWDGLAGEGIAVARDGVEIGRLQLMPTLAAEGDVEDADRSGTELLFLDTIDAAPAPGHSPRPLTGHYELLASYRTAPAQLDNPLAVEDVTLPITTPPQQVPRLVSVGIALSPYERSPDYSSTEPRRRMLWLQFDADPEDPNDALFARVLRASPDPLLAGINDDRVPEQPVEPPLPIDPEFTRVIVPGQSDDRAGLGAMQRLIAGDAAGHYLLPLPPGVHDRDPQLLGFHTYEFRVGHAQQWSTAQGRFGNALRVAGVQHPPPELACAVDRSAAGVLVSAAYATPVHDGASLRPFVPTTSIWVLLYAQVTRADGSTRQNVLLGQRLAAIDPRQENLRAASAALYGTATWSQFELAGLMQATGLGPDAPISALAVEILPNTVPSADPVGADLGSERILRTSPLVAIPDICTCD
jgi:hypothetical protein